MRSHRVFFFLIFSIMFASGCVTYKHEMGQKIDPLKTDQIIEGKTTEAEAVALLGAPQMVQERPDGSKILVYMHSKTEIYGRPYMTDAKGGTSSEKVFLGIRNGLIRKKWQSNTNLPTRSVSGQTLNIPQEFK